MRLRVLTALAFDKAIATMTAEHHGTTVRPLHYLIFHPTRRPFNAEGAQLLGGRKLTWRGTLWADRIPVRTEANEDPFIWADEWLYSYCHATQIKRVDRGHSQPRVAPGSMLFFCSTPHAKRTQQLAVDTVFEVAQCMVWPQPGVEPPGLHRFGPTTPEYQRHLKHGIREPSAKGHFGRFTYVARMDGCSFLPMGESGEAFVVESGDVLANAEQRVRQAVPHGQTTRPIELTNVEAGNLITALQGAATKIISVATRERLRSADLKPHKKKAAQ